MNIPYTLSALLVKDPGKMKSISSISDLIMKEQYAFGQITPNIGSKSWLSLKLWFAIKNIGREGYGLIIEDRHNLALKLKNMVDKSTDFVSVNDVDINAVAFMYKPEIKGISINEINQINQAIHKRIIDEGKYHVHQFSIPDKGVFEEGALIYPLRFMPGNPNTNEKNLVQLLEYIRNIYSDI